MRHFLSNFVSLAKDDIAMTGSFVVSSVLAVVLPVVTGHLIATDAPLMKSVVLSAMWLVSIGCIVTFLLMARSVSKRDANLHVQFQNHYEHFPVAARSMVKTLDKC
jgi:hypothetical protein